MKFNGRFNTSDRIPNTSNISITGSNLQGNLVIRTIHYNAMQ